jgi:hypothetical protein
MGVPLVTRLGSAFSGRVAASLLTAAGLPDLVAGDTQAYEDLAIALARDPARLAALRRRLRDNRARAPLFDTGRYTRRIEAAYQARRRRSPFRKRSEVCGAGRDVQAATMRRPLAAGRLSSARLIACSSRSGLIGFSTTQHMPAAI